MQQEQRKAGSEGVPEKTYGLNHSIPQEDEIAALKLELEQKGVRVLPSGVCGHPWHPQEQKRSDLSF